MNELSGGELQRIRIALCLAKPAQVYILDEPSANLDIEKRLVVTRVVKRFILNNNKCAFIVEHDMMMAVSFAQEYTSRILLVNDGAISEPMPFQTGINTFLQSLNITMRLAKNNNRPRINKVNSQLDKEQKKTRQYYS